MASLPYFVQFRQQGSVTDVVLCRMGKLSFFLCSKQDQGLKAPAVPLCPNLGQVSPGEAGLWLFLLSRFWDKVTLPFHTGINSSENVLICQNQNKYIFVLFYLHIIPFFFFTYTDTSVLKFKFIYSHLFNYNTTTIRKKRSKKRSNYTLN